MNLHGQIMNIPFKQPEDVAWTVAEQQAAKIGHREARHAAAELALSADKLIETLQEIARQDPIEAALNPQWAAMIARHRLDEYWYEIHPERT